MKTDFELEQELRMQFDDYLNDCHDTITIAGMVFFPSDILKECDPIAYRIFLNEFESEMEENK